MPIVCFESNGSVKLEPKCQYESISSTIDNNSQYDKECHQCVDIPFWQYTTDFKQAVKSNYDHFAQEFQLEPSFFIAVNLPEYSFEVLQHDLFRPTNNSLLLISMTTLLL